MPNETRTDADLLTTFLEEEDRAALTLLIERHSGLVWRVARQYLPGKEDVEDVFQSTFRTLVEHGSQIRQRGTVAAWLVQVTRNAALRQLKTSNRIPIEINATAVETSMAAETQAERQEEIDALFEELETLPVKYQESVVLCCLEGRTQEEAAAELGLTPSSVKARLARGRKLLKSRLLKRGVGFTAVLAAWETGTASAGMVVSSQLVQSAVAGCMAKGSTAGVSAVGASSVKLGTGGIAMAKSTKIVIAVSLLFLSGLGITGMVFDLSPRSTPVAKSGGNVPTISPPILTLAEKKAIDQLRADLQIEEERYLGIEVIDSQRYINHLSAIPPGAIVDGSPLTPVGEYYSFLRERRDAGMRLSTTIDSMTGEYHVINQQNRCWIRATATPIYVVQTDLPNDGVHCYFLNTNHAWDEIYDGGIWLVVQDGQEQLRENRKGSRFLRYTPHKLFTDAPNLAAAPVFRSSFLLSDILSTDENSTSIKTRENGEQFELWCEVAPRKIADINSPLEMVIHAAKRLDDGRLIAANEIHLQLSRTHNLIPESAMEYEITDGRRILKMSYRVDRWLEPEPGIWYPSEVNRKMYLPESSGGEGVATEIFSNFKVISLHADYSTDFFKEKLNEIEALIKKDPPP